MGAGRGLWPAGPRRWPRGRSGACFLGQPEFPHDRFDALASGPQRLHCLIPLAGAPDQRGVLEPAGLPRRPRPGPDPVPAAAPPVAQARVLSGSYGGGPPPSPRAGRGYATDATGQRPGPNPVPYLVSGERQHCGLSVHVLTPDMDRGPILRQVKLDMSDGDGHDELWIRMFNSAPALLSGSSWTLTGSSAKLKTRMKDPTGRRT